ncbi:unnamed protein product [Rotaria sp. Silwood2]|nr:unnamed protein product [Rotaria sp. Silwood2]CAF2463607.1 unnamed protein product [Rotaria sp. Silwood2]CAF2853364.1 unnamed protein product [Rotaria sp. Silwood2]CAF3932029.1 unnamed protein product [Rotaria sp. Silwood2]CAF4056183.1 unnamed protein product [Rotaria sp. Silwood2]
MILFKSIYRLSIRYCIILCFLVAAFSIVFSLIFFRKDNEENLIDLNQYDDKVTFWSNDYHISPIHDLKHLLTPLGVRFIDKSLSGSCSLTDSCAKHLRILSAHNGMNPNKAIRKQFYEYYKNHPLMNRVDAFVCFHPAAMCELFMPFNRTIIVIASTRYELGRFSTDEWNEWNKNLRIIASDPRNIVAANNLYDAEYIRYFTGINATVLSSICDYTRFVYRPNKRNLEYIFIPSHKQIYFNQQFLDELKVSIKKFNAPIIVKPLRQLYKFYRYINLVRHPAIIYLPYQVSLMSIFEQYSMNIPLFFPSLDLLSEWHLKYSVVFDRTWDKALSGVSKNSSAIPGYELNSSVPDPNNEYDLSAIRYWLKFADFYQWPHITYFNSTDDLTLKLMNTNLNFISEQMSEYNRKKKIELLEHWKTILNRISTSSFFLKKKEMKIKKIN